MELVVFMGLQGAGKSSFYRARFAETHVHVSKDLFSRNARNKAARQREQIQAALSAGRSVVVDNTNPTRAERTELLELAQHHGAVALGYYFQSVLVDCLARNARRPDQSRVPSVGLFATSKRLELPSYDEGYAALHYVRLIEPEGFEVSPWKDEA